MNRDHSSEDYLHILRILDETDPHALESNPAECIDTCVELARLKPSADPVFQRNLKDQMLQKMREQPHYKTPKRRWHATPRMLSLLLLLGLLLTPFIWFIARPNAVDAQDILERAQYALAAPPVSDIQTLEVIEEISIYYEVNTTHARIHTWYRGDNQWRTEYTGVTRPYSGANDGTIISVNDGTTIWQYTSPDDIVQITETPPTQAVFFDPLAASAESIDAVLQKAYQCHNPEVVGQEIVAGRQAHIVHMGVSSCPSNSASEFNGEQTIWVDTETFRVLKRVVQDTDSPDLRYKMETTHIVYNGPIDASLFEFTPPLGATVIDMRETAIRQTATPTISPESEKSEPIDVERDIFVPSTIPSDLTQTVSTRNNGRDHLVQIDYHDDKGEVILQVLNGPAGCCLDADPRKAHNAVTLMNGTEAYFLQIEAAYGGPILWFQQQGSYVALSGPTMTQDDLVQFANSLDVLVETLPEP